jgi:hypothetical protein
VQVGAFHVMAYPKYLGCAVSVLMTSPPAAVEFL